MVGNTNVLYNQRVHQDLYRVVSVVHSARDNQNNVVDHVTVGTVIQEGRQRFIRLDHTPTRVMLKREKREGTLERIFFQSSTSFCVHRSTIVLVMRGDGKSAKYLP